MHDPAPSTPPPEPRRHLIRPLSLALTLAVSTSLLACGGDERARPTRGAGGAGGAGASTGNGGAGAQGGIAGAAGAGGLAGTSGGGSGGLRASSLPARDTGAMVAGGVVSTSPRHRLIHTVGEPAVGTPSHSNRHGVRVGLVPASEIQP